MIQQRMNKDAGENQWNPVLEEVRAVGSTRVDRLAFTETDRHDCERACKFPSDCWEWQWRGRHSGSKEREAVETVIWVSERTEEDSTIVGRHEGLIWDSYSWKFKRDQYARLRVSFQPCSAPSCTYRVGRELGFTICMGLTGEFYQRREGRGIWLWNLSWIRRGVRTLLKRWKTMKRGGVHWRVGKSKEGFKDNVLSCTYVILFP